MNLSELRTRYSAHYQKVSRDLVPEDAARAVVGGDYDAVGALEYYVLKAHGVQPHHLVVDVGCGTGRLATQLAKRGHEQYVGYDIMKSAVDDARRRCGGKPGWHFAEIDGLRLPLADSCADFVCLFSVLTHITHEHSYLLLKEAHRVLRAGGVVLLTFLEFAIPCHWTQFESAIGGFGGVNEPIVFLDRDAITEFSEHIGFAVLGLVDGDKPTFPIDEDIACGDGRVLRGRGYLGQSLGILQKPDPVA